MVALTAICFVAVVITALSALMTFFVVRDLRAPLPREPVEPRRPYPFRHGPPPEG
ncbi:hypothetical protein KIK06_17440 [Nocardiopsis sp. EMB25]|uniref:hypothetical protein n=1 Tax=Nocardiopsis sp. EMB25 TaxID=2835867 RepID=UPI0022844273|nr:hypothetical protein [Nocardiopsis sp. EMB25]MCY9785672.1 hypothetical protein [Nocardiopsis sp. EMB25]